MTVSLEGCCVSNDFKALPARVRVLDGFTAAKELQDRVAAGEAVERELLKAGRIALAVLRPVSNEERLSWALDLSDAVPEDATDCASSADDVAHAPSSDGGTWSRP